MPEKFTRHFLKTKETEVFLKKASEKLKADLEQILKNKIKVEFIQTDFAEIYLINEKPLLAKVQENIFPTLIFEEFFALSPKVFVDMGAVPHVCNGRKLWHLEFAALRENLRQEILLLF